MRLTEMHGVLALQDSVGPYLAAVRWDWRAHAPGYGFSLLIPYWFSLQVSSSLWDAAGAICGLHATIAPLAMLLALRVQPKAWGAALAIGALAATDPGLIDTARSGAEGYFASTLVVGALLASRGWGWLLFGVAVANHPLAIASIPLLVSRERCGRSSAWGAVAAAVLIGHQSLGWSSPGVEAIDGPAMLAAAAMGVDVINLR